MTVIMNGDDLVEHVDLAEGWRVGGRGDGGVGVWNVWVGVVYYLEGTELGFGCRGHHDSGGIRRGNGTTCRFIKEVLGALSGARDHTDG